MKAIKYLSILSVALALPLCFASCSDDDEDVPVGTADPLNLVGTTWQVVASSDEVMDFTGATVSFGTGVAEINIPAEAGEGGMFTFAEGDGNILQWDFGDSSVTGIWQGDDSSATFTYTWDNYGVMGEMVLERVG